MLKQGLLAAAAAAFLTVLAGGSAQAQFFGSFGGSNVSQGNCQALARSIGPGKVWFSQFSGYHNDAWDRGKVHASGVGCFRSYAECKAWLYRTQSDWPQMMDFTFCKRGLPNR